MLPSNIDFILMQPIEMDTDMDTDTEGMVPPSLLMYFMHPGSPFLECVLLEFDSETSLLQLCLVTSHPPGGKDASAECVQVGVLYCTVLHCTALHNAGSRSTCIFISYRHVSLVAFTQQQRKQQHKQQQEQE